MDFDSSDSSDAKYANKVKTLKQSKQENLIKAKVIPASKLAETAKRNAALLREFEAAAEDEKRHKTTAAPAPQDKLKNLPMTRESSEE